MSDLWEAPHPEFRKCLRASEPARWFMALLLSQRGYTVTIPPLKEAKTRAEAAEFRDEFDLRIELGTIEVKWSTRDFVTEADWPFPLFMVCKKSVHDSRAEKPLSYVHLSDKLTHAAIVDVEKTRSHWVVRTHPEWLTNEPQQYWLVPKGMVTFKPVSTLPYPPREPGFTKRKN